MPADRLPPRSELPDERCGGTNPSILHVVVPHSHSLTRLLESESPWYLDVVERDLLRKESASTPMARTTTIEEVYHSGPGMQAGRTALLW
jgi:hypothetical protein